MNKKEGQGLAHAKRMPNLVCQVEAPVRRFLVARPFRQLCAMPNRNNPNCLPSHPVKETIRPNNDFTMRKSWKLRNRAAGFRKLFKSPKNLICFLTKPLGSHGAVLANILQALQKLGAS